MDHPLPLLAEEAPALPRRLRCYHPFQTLMVDKEGRAYSCTCPTHRSRSMGPDGSTRTQSYEEIWNGPRLQSMRAAFLAGDYGKYCNTATCSLLRDYQAEPPEDALVIRAVNEGRTVLEHGIHTLIHEIDTGCNLYCSHCRTDKIRVDNAYVRRNVEELGGLIRNGKLKVFYPHGGGEVLVMRDVINLLASGDLAAQSISVELHTNLIPLTPALWARIGHNRFRSITFSADGCSEETYGRVRRGTRWAVMEERIRFLAGLRRDGRVGRVVWAFCVSRSTYKDVGHAIDLAQEWGIDQIYFQPLLGRRPGRGENIFWEYDEDRLDELHDLLERSGAWSNPKVYVGALPMVGRQYREFRFRLQSSRLMEGEGEAAVSDRILGDLLRAVKRGETAVPNNLSAEEKTWIRWRMSRPDSTVGTVEEGPFHRLNLVLQAVPSDWGSEPGLNRLFIYGAGSSGLRVLQSLRHRPGGVVAGFIDSTRNGIFENMPLLSLSDYAAQQHPDDRIIIASEQAGAIAENLERIGVGQAFVADIRVQS